MIAAGKKFIVRVSSCHSYYFLCCVGKCGL